MSAIHQVKLYYEQLQIIITVSLTTVNNTLPSVTDALTAVKYILPAVTAVVSAVTVSPVTLV